MEDSAKIPVAISQCLLGERVRFDGGHKRSRYVTDQLGQYFDFQSFCPEVAIGLGIPRKPIRLVVTDAQTRVQQVDNPQMDVTDELRQYAAEVAPGLHDICGYIFMQNSPSCGAYGMKRYGENGYPLDKKGRGAFADEIMQRLPLLPVEEAGRLNDAGLRENFITRVFAYRDWKLSVAASPSPKALIDFYSRYKYQVMAHHVPSYKAIGKLLADLKTPPIEQVCDEFVRIFMTALEHLATRKGNTNTMMHLRGYLREQLNVRDNQELSDLIENYRLGLVPLVVPMTLLKHHLMKVDDEYLHCQTFWSPHPERLGLRNVIAS
ncbi:DUF523 and DUF1722 domain-containing protein [Gilvimarinus sp. SDUM040013]|uniref:DUF523 and DUF1722 domain-containing protein n=1 Tax=Gilvimarinus gilvus TaxID=3058038 RepID=A0ABU4S1X3_9GAMM|nr:DUF523 and DUF1722 domain-containing protein [Gilvimarinus sp. SDUM040013]MDO3385564.1 DUF523 and DUF1722 domain-containing protein [Gilvimarinus sp. SDUM040013]MDX6851185.1 DUF523 and DUF1722 domain-containing protein [Gilvimarinus sp. SDUM040013]